MVEETFGRMYKLIHVHVPVPRHAFACLIPITSLDVTHVGLQVRARTTLVALQHAEIRARVFESRSRPFHGATVERREWSVWRWHDCVVVVKAEREAGEDLVTSTLASCLLKPEDVFTWFHLSLD